MPGKEIKGRSKRANYRDGGRVKRAGGGPGLYANIAAKKARIKAGSGEKMRTARRTILPCPSLSDHPIRLPRPKLPRANLIL